MWKAVTFVLVMLLCSVSWGFFEEEVIWITREEDQETVSFRIEAPLIQFNQVYADPEAGVTTLFGALSEAQSEIPKREAAIAVAEGEIERLKKEIEWIREEIMDLSELSVASDMLSTYKEMAGKCARIMKGKELSGSLLALVTEHGPVVQTSVGKNKKGKVVPSFTWWQWHKPTASD